MNKILLTMGILAMALLVACNGASIGVAGDDSNAMRPLEVKVKGPLKDFIEIVDKPYKVYDDSTMLDEVYIEFKRLNGKLSLQKGEKLVDSEYENGLYLNLMIEYLDEDGNVIEKRDWRNGCQDLQPIVDGEPGETCTVLFGLPNKKPAKFRVYAEMKHIADNKDLEESVETEIEEAVVPEPEIAEDAPE